MFQYKLIRDKNYLYFLKNKKIYFNFQIINLNLFNFKYFFFLILYLYFILYKKYIKKINRIKICLCTIGKSENRYVREYVEHYKNYGVDKIFLYDNNDITGESFDDVLSDFIKNQYIEIH